MLYQHVVTVRLSDGTLVTGRRTYPAISDDRARRYRSRLHRWMVKRYTGVERISTEALWQVRRTSSRRKRTFVRIRGVGIGVDQRQKIMS